MSLVLAAFIRMKSILCRNASLPLFVNGFAGIAQTVIKIMPRYDKDDCRDQEFELIIMPHLFAKKQCHAAAKKDQGQPAAMMLSPA
jgi:hypothetical protein